MRWGWGRGRGPGTGEGGLGDESPHPLALSGSVWSSYRKSCVDMVMKWLVPESSGRYVNRMTNEALHKGRLHDLLTVRTKALIWCYARPRAGAIHIFLNGVHWPC